jgi:hypothetical protein
MKDSTRLLSATQPVRLRQSQHSTPAGRPVLRVDVEQVPMPDLRQVQLQAGVTLSGSFKPQRVYRVHLGIGWLLSMSPTEDGVRVDLVDVRTTGGAMCPDAVWRWAFERVDVQVPWWAAVKACEWAAGEAGEVAA